MLFKYKKLSQDGAVIAGVAEFNSLKEAEVFLITEGELLLEIKKLTHVQKLTLKSEELFELTYQMQQLISAGLPIYESLLSLKEKKVRYSELLDKLADKIQQGQSLSSSMSEFRQCFDSLYLAIIQASEASGEIKEGFSALKSLLEKKAKMIKILKNALIYPSILLVFAFVIVNALIFFIVPSLKDLFEGREVASLTSLVLRVSNFCNNNVFQLLTILGLLVAGSTYLFVKGWLKETLLKMLNIIPFCRDLNLSIKLENFFACLGLLLNRGINLKDALILSKGVLAHAELENTINTVLDEVLKGKKFSSALSYPFPFVAQRLISLAEETGKLGPSCDRLSEIFHEDVEKKLQKLTAFLQPALLAFIGLVVGLVVLSILLPLTDVGGFI